MNIILDNKTYFLDTLIATLLVILLVTSSDFFCFSFLLLFFFRVRKNSPWINKFTIYNNLESRSLWVISPGPKSRLAQFTDFCRSKRTRTSTNWKKHCTLHKQCFSGVNIFYSMVYNFYPLIHCSKNHFCNVFCLT